MSDSAIRLEGIGKQYHITWSEEAIRHDGEGRLLPPQYPGDATLREALTNAFASAFRWTGRLFSGQAMSVGGLRETIWALRDVSCEIKCGEVVGIIGPNGAGKSTLLKIISRITEPTAGRGEIRGRVGSLLEVGTGFHNELTGRENIFLNGAILGMKRAEILRKFDEIVAFAEIERFLDTPVKYYSSGMYMRLAFAVAAHLDPEILLVDEVLAVGDARFQKKCLGKMQDVGHQGRTVLFVSHNMDAITRLCQRAILLDGGRVLRDGSSQEVVGAYLTSVLSTAASREWPDRAEAPGGEIARLRAVRVRDKDGQTTDAVDIRQPISIEMEYDVLKPGCVLMPSFDFFTQAGVCAFLTLDQDNIWRKRLRGIGRYVSTARIPGNFLSEGTMFVHCFLAVLDSAVSYQIISHEFGVPDAVAFQVIDSPDGDSARGDWAGHLRGVVRPLLKWTTRFSPDRETAAIKIEHEGR